MRIFDLGHCHIPDKIEGVRSLCKEGPAFGQEAFLIEKVPLVIIDKGLEE